MYERIASECNERPNESPLAFRQEGGTCLAVSARACVCVFDYNVYNTYTYTGSMPTRAFKYSERDIKSVIQHFPCVLPFSRAPAVCVRLPSVIQYTFYDAGAGVCVVFVGCFVCDGSIRNHVRE